MQKDNPLLPRQEVMERATNVEQPSLALTNRSVAHMRSNQASAKGTKGYAGLMMVCFHVPQTMLHRHSRKLKREQGNCPLLTSPRRTRPLSSPCPFAYYTCQRQPVTPTCRAKMEGSRAGGHPSSCCLLHHNVPRYKWSERCCKSSIVHDACQRAGLPQPLL